MGSIKRLMVEAEDLANECLSRGGSHEEATDIAFDFIWAHANDEESVMHHALEMARSIVTQLKTEKLNS